jgi:hypothetical protein
MPSDSTSDWKNVHSAQVFLESVLEGICDPLGIDVNRLITDGGRTRLVLGSGCVARDYLNLTRVALRRANERVPDAGRVRNRITAEDVNEAVGRIVDNEAGRPPARLRTERGSTSKEAYFHCRLLPE